MQQINLYTKALKKKADPLSAEKMLGYSAVFVVLLVFVSLAQWWSGSMKQDELAQLKQQHKQLTSNVQKLSAELAANKSDHALEARLGRKEIELANKKKVLDALSGQDFGNTKGFAEHFTGLARQRVEGVWVTGLHIHSGGQRVNLKGATLKPDLVPEYLKRLANESSFAEIEFQSFLMERTKESEHIQFHLHSNKKEAG